MWMYKTLNCVEQLAKIPKKKMNMLACVVFCIAINSSWCWISVVDNYEEICYSHL